MIFIFGYHPISSQEGPVEEIECPNCHNTRHWILAKMTYYINLFFIPLIPTRTEYYKSCPVCRFRHELTREEYQSSKPLARLNNEAIRNNMSESEYESRLKDLEL